MDPRSDEENSHLPSNLGAYPDFPNLAGNCRFVHLWQHCSAASLSVTMCTDEITRFRELDTAPDGLCFHSCENANEDITNWGRYVRVAGGFAHYPQRKKMEYELAKQKQEKYAVAFSRSNNPALMAVAEEMRAFRHMIEPDNMEFIATVSKQTIRCTTQH